MAIEQDLFGFYGNLNTFPVISIFGQTSLYYPLPLLFTFDSITPKAVSELNGFLFTGKWVA